MVSLYDNGEGTPRPHNIQMPQTLLDSPAVLYVQFWSLFHGQEDNQMKMPKHGR